MIKTTVLSAPVAAVINLQYPFPIVSWLLDVRGLHALYEDQVSISDTHSALVEKAEFDQVGFSDAQLYALALGKMDSVSFPDQFDRVCDFYRDFSEIVGISDTRNIILDKHLADGIKVVDLFSAQISKPVSDGVGFGESRFEKLTTKVIPETVGISDTQAISLVKPLADGITLSDQAIQTTSKGISDGVVFGDSQFTKSLSPKYQETVQFSDSFFLNGNSYCDFTYFAEDYVGAVRQI